jgi:DNA polymerase-1
LLRSDYTNPSIEDILAYADTRDFGLAREKIFKDLRETGRLNDVYEKIERPLIPVIRRMNETGIALNVPYLKKLAKEYNSELSAIASRIYKHAGHEFNISSPKQLGVVIYDELKITPERQKRTATGARTTREEELLKLSDEHPIINDILAYRELSKLLGTYVEKMPELVQKDGRLHATFLQAGSATGRMASENPGVQNIPIKTEYGRRIRDGFIAEKGNLLVSIDYSQIELRVAAGLSGDKNLVKVFKDGGDVHSAVASQVFNVPPELVDREMRRRAKVINFGILYGMGVNALRQNLGAGVTREEAAKFLNDYFANFSTLHTWIENVKANAARNGYTETLFGRRRYFPGFKSPLMQMRAQAERMAMNAPIQGTQADIIKLAMVEADELIEKKKWREKVRLVMQVHDELVYEIDANIAEEVAREIQKVMEGAVETVRLSGVPIKAEAKIGEHWGEMQKLI